MPPQQQDRTGVTRDEGGRFVKGRSGNPGGRPKGESVLAEIERQLELEDDDGRPQRVRLVEKLITMALGGEVRAIDLLLKRVAPERLALEGDSHVTLVLRDYTGTEFPRRARALSASEPDVEPLPALLGETVEAVALVEELEKSDEEKLDELQAHLEREMKPEPRTWSIARPWESERQAEAIRDDD